MNLSSLWKRLERVPDDPFYQPRPRLWMPRAMAEAPRLTASALPAAVERRYALLVNPFYPKSPHGSFGKHVLTPSLALTSIAAATPGHWRVAYWEENLLQGPSYLFMCYLYKRSNWLWHWLIKHRLVRSVWRPFVQWTRWRHLACRRRLEAQAPFPGTNNRPAAPAQTVAAGV